MKINYLFPHKLKKIGWLILIPSVVLGLFTLIYELEPSFLDFNIPIILTDNLPFSENNGNSGLVKNNFLNEILGILIIAGSLLVAFSKEKYEDEYIAKIRLESLVWAVYVNYGILIFSILFIFGTNFYWVMLFNIFTVLWFFIIRFNWQISKLKNSAYYEEQY